MWLLIEALFGRWDLRLLFNIDQRCLAIQGKGLDKQDLRELREFGPITNHAGFDIRPLTRTKLRCRPHQDY